MEAAAAWAAAAIALWVALAQTRENRQHLRREAIAELDVRSTEWETAAAALLGGIRRFLNGHGNGVEINGPLLANFTAATANLNRALRVAEMVCPHKQLHDELDAMQATIGQFAGLLNPTRDDGAAGAADLQAVFDQGKPLVLQIVQQSVTAIEVGMSRYRVRPFVPKRVLARKVEVSGRRGAGRS